MTFESPLKDFYEIERIRTVVKMVLDEEMRNGLSITANAINVEINIQPIEMSHVGEELDALYNDAEERIKSIY